MLGVLTRRTTRDVYCFEAESAESLERWIAVLGNTALGNAAGVRLICQLHTPIACHE